MPHRLHRRDLLKTSAAWALAPAVLGWDLARAADPYADAKFVDGEPPAIADGSFTIAVLPDTQIYCQSHPEQFLAQTEWIVQNRLARNVACVLHLGDITNHNTPEQWEVAVQAMDTLDGEVPYFLVPGNHDYSEGGRATDRTTRLNDYFPVAKFRGLPTFGGTYDREPDRMENSFHTFEAGGRKLLVLGLEFGPRKDVIRWANEVVAAHAELPAILVTHAYMYFDETRYDWGKYGPEQRWNPHGYGVAQTTDDDVTDGQELWDALVSKHGNFVMTLNGHVLNDGLARLTSQDDAGRDVHQTLVNFQLKPNGGDGWLRLIECRPDGTTAVIHDYSPTRNQWNASAQNRFDLNLAPVAG
ncbi:metallophosphoesterase [Alienimonas californiensis]|uniref:Calcineurin-like phosphoesterase n=1 Tax=Alienimonas californiensis TaxID=2527989 RepID=A0A517P3P8_9PLAN|nr:metallophosphoesterase [Alienimonas californiensis]QDT13995.1 Calcineurin-like phosphoesterase [Alienimonas californiensis]